MAKPSRRGASSPIFIDFVGLSREWISPGFRFAIDGKIHVIETTWNQGKHAIFKTTEGIEFIDLHKRTDLKQVVYEEQQEDILDAEDS